MLNYELCMKNLALLGELYEKSISETMYKLYYEILKDMQDEDFKQAIRRLLSERVYPTFPKPAEILSLTSVTKVEVQEIDQDEIRAKELISACETMNTILGTEAHRANMTFDDYIKNYEFTNISQETMAILNNVKPYYDYKLLISKIRHYSTSIDALNAFKNALKYSTHNVIENKVQKMIKG